MTSNGVHTLREIDVFLEESSLVLFLFKKFSFLLQNFIFYLSNPSILYVYLSFCRKSPKNGVHRCVARRRHSAHYDIGSSEAGATLICAWVNLQASASSKLGWKTWADCTIRSLSWALHRIVARALLLPYVSHAGRGHVCAHHLQGDDECEYIALSNFLDDPFLSLTLPTNNPILLPWGFLPRAPALLPPAAFALI